MARFVGYQPFMKHCRQAIQLEAFEPDRVHFLTHGAHLKHDEFGTEWYWIVPFYAGDKGDKAIKVTFVVKTREKCDKIILEEGEKRIHLTTNMYELLERIYVHFVNEGAIT